MSWKKRLVSFVLALCMMVLMLPMAAFAEEDGNSSKKARYTVLVLDTSASANFLDSQDEIIYTADSAIDYVKQAAQKFLINLSKNSNRENYVAVISYKRSAEVVADFTTDIGAASDSINKLEASQDRSIYEGLKTADELLSNVPDDEDITKNVVLVTTGMTNVGEYDYSGHYDDTVVGGSWQNANTKIRLYAYANAAYNAAEKVKERADLYTLGMFQTMEDMPEEGKDVAELFRLTAKDLATSEDLFYEVRDIDALDSYFDKINEDIETIDSMSIPAKLDHCLGSYTDTYTEPSNEEEVRDAFQNWTWALDRYFDTLNEAVKTENNSYTGNGNVISDLREQDQANEQPVLTLNPLADDEQIEAAYAGLEEFYHQFRGNAPSIGKIDLNDDIITIQSKIIKEIERSFIDYDFSLNYNGYVITVVAYSEYTAFDGKITVAGKGKIPWTFKLCSNRKSVALTMAQYLQILTDAAEDATKAGLRSYMNEFRKVTCISDFTEEQFTDAIGRIYDYMNSKGYGKLTKYAAKIYQGYELGKSISKISNQSRLEKKLENAEDLYKQIKNFKITDDSVKQYLTKEALKDVERTREKLEDILYNYIYHPDENLSYERLWLEKVGDWINNGFKKLGFKCPVSITVYDEDGNQIGYAEDGYCEYNDNIYIEVDGDIKTLYIPEDMNVSVQMTGTDAGIMNYTVEDFKELGQPIGRMNYYDVPLTKGGIYTQNITAGELSKDTTALPIIGEDSESIYADEYISSSDSAVCNISCNMSEGGNVSGAGQYARGDDVQLSAYADEGYRFAGWYYNKKLVGIDMTYHMTAKEDATVQALFRPEPKKQTITCDYSDNFSKSLKENSFNLNAKTTGDGHLNYYTDYTGVVDVSTDGTVTLNKTGTAEIYIVASETTACDVEIKTLTITVTNSVDSLPFTDVSENDWFAPYVQFVYDNGLMNGTSKTTFAPQATLNRAMVAQVLYNYDKRVDSPYRATNGKTFKDVSKSDWFYDAIQWASANGIASGVGDGYFEPNTPVTREQVAQFLYNYNGKPSVSGNLPFSDADKVSGWAKNAMLWAYQNKIINGTTSSDGGLVLDPQGGATRAQAAAILTNYMKTMM